jgi:CPA2 family monovalent cation:H+ antiporter-2
MHALPRLLIDLALVLGVAGLTSLLFHRLRLPVVLGYVLAGLVVGPHLPIPLAVDEATVQPLADLGVTLLMFSIGLEFSLQRLFRAGPTALLMGSVQVGFGMALGGIVARLLGWSATEAVFVGAALAISSTMVVAKLFEEHRPSRTLREVVFSVLVVQDLYAILLLTALGTYARVGGLRAAELGGTLLRLGLFLAVVILAGRLLVPRFLRWVADHARPESLLVTSAGLCFVLAAGAARAGFSLALGAFLAGMLASESGRVRAIERQVAPLRDLFTAVFFVAVGMMLDLQALPPLLMPILLFTLLVLLGNALSLGASGLLAGLPLRTSLRTGLALGQIGEFGYILIGVGIAAGVVRKELYSMAVAVGLLTAFLSPFLMRASSPFADLVEGRLPARFRTSLGLYQAWAESLRARGIRRGEGRGLRRPLAFLLLDAGVLAALVVCYGFLLARWTPWAEGQLHWGRLAVQLLGASLLGALAALLVLGILRQGKILARDLAVLAPGPEAAGGARQGRHLLAGGLRVAVLLMVGLPLVAALQPFAPHGLLLAVAFAVFALTVVLQLLRARRLARELPGPMEWLLTRVRDPWSAEGEPPGPQPSTLRSLRLGGRCPSLGRRLSELDLPGRTGVTVVALLRDGHTLTPLRPSPVLQEGDLLGLAGPETALDEAEALLGGQS